MAPLKKTLTPRHLKQSLESRRIQCVTNGVLCLCECGGVVRTGAAAVTLERVKWPLCCVVWEWSLWGPGIFPILALGFGVFQSTTPSPRKPWFSPSKHPVWLKPC
jgi:hypothetical protein